MSTHQKSDIDGFDSLAALALNLRWSWNHATDEIWRHLDKELWEITHNPWVVLQTASQYPERISSSTDLRKEPSVWRLPPIFAETKRAATLNHFGEDSNNSLRRMKPFPLSAFHRARA